jgi:hypothetical protein
MSASARDGCILIMYQAQIPGHWSTAMHEGTSKQDFQIHGDYVGGDKITASNLNSGSTIVIGRGAQFTVNEASGQELARAFTWLYAELDAQPDEALLARREEVVSLIRRLEYEVRKGGEADLSRVERFLAQLQSISVFAYERTLAVLSDPTLNLVAPLRALVTQLKGTLVPAPAVPTVESLQAKLAAANLPADTRASLTAALQALAVELARGERADVRRVRVLLNEFIVALPSLRPDLALWLEASPEASTAVKIVARKLLLP